MNYPETYDIIVKRLRDELSAAKASSSPIKHLVVLLGIPIAYPVSLDTICDSFDSKCRLAFDLVGEYILQSVDCSNQISQQEIWVR